MTFKSVAEFLDPQNGHRPTTAERRLIEANSTGPPFVLDGKGTDAPKNLLFQGEPKLQSFPPSVPLSLEKSQLPGLFAQGVKVAGSLLLSNLTATGTVNLVSAKVVGQLDCVGATLDGNGSMALNAQRLHVEQGLQFRLLARTAGRINLTSAHVSDLVDDATSWPKEPADLSLDGFTYDRIIGPTTFAAR